MNLAQLPQDTDLYQLIKQCYLQHELVLTVCSDGAMVMECLECPFWKLLDEREENFLREQEKPSEEVPQVSP